MELDGASSPSGFIRATDGPAVTTFLEADGDALLPMQIHRQVNNAIYRQKAEYNQSIKQSS